MEANMANGITPLLIGLAIAVATGTSVALTPIQQSQVPVPVRPPIKSET